jgi:hypothetical protein
VVCSKQSRIYIAAGAAGVVQQVLLAIQSSRQASHLGPNIPNHPFKTPWPLDILPLLFSAFLRPAVAALQGLLLLPRVGAQSN